MKKILFCLLCLGICTCIPLQVRGETSPIQDAGTNKSQEILPNLTSQYVYVIDPDTNQTLIDLNSEEKIYPASMTKMLSILVAIENIEDLSQSVTITKKMLEGLSEEGASVAGYQVNDVKTAQDLLYGAMLPSGADAINALAYTIGGSLDGFVDMMNKKAEEIGMSQSHFTNATGLHDDKHYSTAKDIATLVKYAMQNETFLTVYKTMQYIDSSGLPLTSTIQSAFDDYGLSIIGLQGGKTGYTTFAGHCLASLLEINAMKLICITAGAYTDISLPTHIEDTQAIASWLSEAYYRAEVIPQDTTLVSYQGKKIFGSFKNNVTQTSALILDIPKTDTISYSTDVPSEIKIHSKTQTKNATVSIYANDALFYQYTQEYTVPKANDIFNRFLIWIRDIF